MISEWKGKRTVCFLFINLFFRSFGTNVIAVLLLQHQNHNNYIVNLLYMFRLHECNVQYLYIIDCYTLYFSIV
jgi:hypothetical protein